ncbi:nuclease-related domain-containing protein [Bacillus sp. AK128]
MIAKERGFPIKIRKLEATLRRLSKNHRKRADITDELAKNYSGYRGEQSMDYYFSYLDNKRYTILHNLRLFDQHHYFQMDSLIISPCFILIVEIKNIKGTLLFERDYKQLIRMYNGKEEVFPSPLIQAKMHQAKLRQWLHAQKLPEIPIDYMVVMSHPQAIIKTTTNYREALEKVTTSFNFINKYEALERIHPHEISSSREVKKMVKHLIANHTEGNPEILKQFGITSDELVEGIYCPSCTFIPMLRKSTKWFCPQCSCFSKDAHIPSIKDYFLLFDSKITSKRFRTFANINSRSVSSRLLAEMNLPFTGDGKARVYYEKCSE